MREMRYRMATLLAMCLLLVMGSCRAQPPVEPSAANAQLALVAAAIDGVRNGIAVTDFARERVLALQPGTAGNFQAEQSGTRLVLFQNDAGTLVRADLYFLLADAPRRAELETLTGALTLYQQSKDSRARAELAATPTQAGAVLFVELLGAQPDGSTPVKSLSARVR